MNVAPSSSRKNVYTCAAVVAVDGVDGGQHVPVDLVPLEHVQAPHHPVEGGLAALVHPVGVVHLRAGRRSRCRPGTRWPSGTRPTHRSAGCRWSGSCSGSAGPAARTGVPGRWRGGRNPGPSSSAHRPARQRPPPGPGREPPATAAGRSPADRRPSGTGCPGTASPWTRRSSTRNPGCIPPRWAWPSRETPAEPPAPSAPGRAAQDHPPDRRKPAARLPRCAGSIGVSGCHRSNTTLKSSLMFTTQRMARKSACGWAGLSHHNVPSLSNAAT